MFEVGYVLLVTLVLAVFGAAAGEIGASIFGWPPLAGTAFLAASIALFVTFGNASVEGLFKYVSFLLYGVYALFMVFALSSFGDEIAARFAIPAPSDGWILGGLTYTGYNVIGAVVILPVIRHLTSQRDAVTARADRGAAGNGARHPLLRRDDRFLSGHHGRRHCRRTSCCGSSRCRCSTCCSSS